MNLSDLESELKKLTCMPPWGKKQSDDWDKESNFIYTYPSYEQLLEILKAKSLPQTFNNYAIHRWYNAMSARGVETIFTSLDGVKPHFDTYDKLTDFAIHGICFDHKTTVFPRGFGKSITYARQNPNELIQWLYSQQSTQGRFHLENRLFIVLYNSDGNHWKLRSELCEMKPIIENYIQNFDIRKLHQFTFEKDKKTLSDVIWFLK
ncbi:MAG: hypothetical protein QM751_15445 [Paludibacteraceae bacterium]